MLSSLSPSASCVDIVHLQELRSGGGAELALYLEPVWCDDGRQREHRAVDGNHVGLDVQFSRITQMAVSQSARTQKVN